MTGLRFARTRGIHTLLQGLCSHFKMSFLAEDAVRLSLPPPAIPRLQYGGPLHEHGPRACCDPQRRREAAAASLGLHPAGLAHEAMAGPQPGAPRPAGTEEHTGRGHQCMRVIGQGAVAEHRLDGSHGYACQPGGARCP